MKQTMSLEMEKKRLTRVWTSLHDQEIAKIQSLTIEQRRTFSGMVRKLILDALAQYN